MIDIPPRYYIGSLAVSAVDMPMTITLIEQQIIAKSPTHICVANLLVANLCQNDAQVCDIENNSFLTLPDGMPLVWLAHLSGRHKVRRVTGPDIMCHFLSQSVEKNYSHLLIGDTQETLDKLQQILHQRYPGIQIKAAVSPPFRELTAQEITDLAQLINQHQPTFAWFSLSAPKQEKLIAKILPQVNSSIMIGVGAAFRFVLGEYQHPHRVFQWMGLEGLFWRYLKNPIRGLRWYAYHIPALFWLAGKTLKKRFYPPKSSRS